MTAGLWRGVRADHRPALPVERFACPANPGADRLGGASPGQHGRGRARVGQARRGSAGAAVPVRAGLAEPEETGGDLGSADRPGGTERVSAPTVPDTHWPGTAALKAFRPALKRLGQDARRELNQSSQLSLKDRLRSEVAT